MSFKYDPAKTPEENVEEFFRFFQSSQTSGGGLNPASTQSSSTSNVTSGAGQSPVAGNTSSGADPDAYGPTRADFTAPILMQTQGDQKVARADKTLNNPDAAKAARQKARQRRRKGVEMKVSGRAAERFQDASDRREERRDDGKTTKRQTQQMDRNFGKAVSRFGAQKASEMAAASGEKRYSKGTEKPTDAEKDTAAHKLARLTRRRDAARKQAGGKNYRDIKGQGPTGDKRRSAAKRARHFNKKIDRQIGRMSRKYGASVAAGLAETAGVTGKKDVYS